MENAFFLTCRYSPLSKMFFFLQGESISDDERSGHYSSSGYYESPVDDEDDDGGLSKFILIEITLVPVWCQSVNTASAGCACSICDCVFCKQFLQNRKKTFFFVMLLFI